MIRVARPRSDTYLELVSRLRLRPLRTEEEYDAAVAMLDTLALRTLDNDEQMYLDALTHFVEDYDRRRRRTPGEGLSALGVLRHLMEESGMGPGDLGKVLGSASAASMILHHKRALSQAQIKKLARHFRVNPGLFLR